MNTLRSTMGETGAWRDGKRWWWLLSPALPLLGVASVLGVLLGGSGLLLWLMPLVFYGLVPLLDWVIGTDPVNAPESAVGALEQDRYYRRIVYAYIPSQYAATILGAWLAVHGGLAWWELLGLVVTAGMANGVGINTAHELGHKTHALERWLAKFTLAPVAYGHFCIEHNKGHHKNVATAEDPASARMGESFWAFLPRTVIGSIRSAWRIEAARLQRSGQRAWSAGNENLQAWGMTVVLFGAITAWLGPWALLFLLVQAAYGAALLEVVNYLEHYGLLRLRDANGRVERCQPRHSWNSNHVMTNLLLYQLQRHSDHHANPTRRYQALRHFEDSPQLPSGYASMVLVAYFPPLWFRLMDPRVVAHHRGDLTRANLQPSRRWQLLAKWMGRAVADRDRGPPILGASGASPQAVVTAARHQCPNCSFIYDDTLGYPPEGFPPGTPWARLPQDWSCPHCAVRDKQDFAAL
ncbi:alkane 1-monooxygenase [Solimonas sp. K1W22B-7]|uniref:fatty acid desaturase n=1 Tax=Solimonas sp. K1W22B-7 TaxID=2303331 RepID=UPI000E32D940|nr:fatty acid desaturase [Solimonas sp. K1W22B-7]AXQ31332.1 alkane 1-monooxygenase [Solimonas sp. K1W22B-7]